MTIWKKYELFKNEFSKQKTALCIIAMTLINSVINILFLRQEYSYVTCLNVFSLYTLMFAIAGIDLKFKIIPNRLLLIGFIIRLLILGIEIIWQPEEAKRVLFHSGIGFLFGLLFLLFLSFISKHGIGYGDVKLFAWIGLCMGLADTYSIMFYSVLAAAVISLYLLFIKSRDKKTQIPFGPFVFVGVYMVLLLRIV